MLNILHAVKHEVKSNGFNSQTTGAVRRAISKLEIDNPRLKTIEAQVIEYIEEESIAMNGVYLGCSDIIESIFGKYKNFSSKSSMKEIGRSILTIPAFVGKIKHDEVKQAMETISANEVPKWLKENIGISFFTKRKEAFKLCNQKTG